MELIASIIGSSISSAAPLLLAAIGLLINERAGVLNLGAEGMMLLAAVAGFAVGIEPSGHWACTFNIRYGTFRIFRPRLRR
jgi:general nucleoside transport system permease protein